MVVAAVGVYSVAGAIEAGVLYAVLMQLTSTLSSRFSSLLALVFAVVALTYVRHSEGVVAYAKAWVLDRAEQLTRHLQAPPLRSAGAPGMPAGSGTARAQDGHPASVRDRADHPEVGAGGVTAGRSESQDLHATPRSHG